MARLLELRQHLGLLRRLRAKRANLNPPLPKDDQAYGKRLYAELQKLSGYDVITSVMGYNAIQQLRWSNRQDTLHLFRDSSQEVIQLLKSCEPENVARHIVTSVEDVIEEAGTDAAMSTLAMVSSIFIIQQ